MSSQFQNDDASILQEAAEEEELLKLEEEIEKLGEKILEYRTTLPGQLSSAISSLLAAQRPVLPTHLIDGADSEILLLTRPDLDAGVSQVVERGTLALPAPNDSEKAEKVQLLKLKVLSNASALPVVLNRMKECMARIDKLDSTSGIIHPIFKKKRTS